MDNQHSVMKPIKTLGVASCIGGPSSSCGEGAKVLSRSPFIDRIRGHNSHLELDWQPLLEVNQPSSNSLDILKKQSSVISQFTQQQVEKAEPFIVLGGDHSCAIGTWAGVLNALSSDKRFALLWIDAHLDAHTLATSPSGNLHGMPVSCLLGEADHALQSCFPSQNFLAGRDLYYFGIRSFEADELVLLSKQNVNIFDTQRIQQQGGTQQVLVELLSSLQQYYDCFAISIDLDAMDPVDAPGVETRAQSGLTAEYVLQALKTISQPEKLLGLEIAEFDPGYDVEHKTEMLVFDIIASIFNNEFTDVSGCTDF